MPSRMVQLAAVAAALFLTDATGGAARSQDPAKIDGLFSFEAVRQAAKARAEHDYRPPLETLPSALANLDYDSYRQIRFKQQNSLWRDAEGGLFEVQFFHRGFNYKRRINISQVVEGRARLVPYETRAFDFGPDREAPKGLGADTGFAGFRVHYPLHTPEYKDEIVVFLGASYFRVLGRNQGYGLSARGLAVDTASVQGEEFPEFTDFWLVRPARDARSLTIYALLDSPSVTGAYRFQITPGAVTQVEVTSELYPRKPIEKVGIAPLTSMFLFGEKDGGRRFDDYRPEVHDSDGLMSQSGAGEWIWRPLDNPRELRVSRLVDENPHGFGLVQRDREFAHFQDKESGFERRPSYWIEPLGDWGRGGVELVEIPTMEEIHDNIVAYWVPETKLEPGAPRSFSYLLSSFGDSHRWPPGGKVVATRIGSASVGSKDNRAPAAMRRFIIDFKGGDLDGLHASQPLEAQLTASNGEIDAVTVERIPELGVWRVAFRFLPNGSEPADLRCYLTLYGEALSETWSFLWS